MTKVMTGEVLDKIEEFGSHVLGLCCKGVGDNSWCLILAARWRMGFEKIINTK